MLPSSYLPATSRNVTPICPNTGRIGVGFTLEDGTVLRLSLDVASATFLREGLSTYISNEAGNQSAGSELKPREPKSVPSEGVNV